MNLHFVTIAIVAFLQRAQCQNITFLTDTEKYGPPLEVIHAYYNQWPTGKEQEQEQLRGQKKRLMF